MILCHKAAVKLSFSNTAHCILTGSAFFVVVDAAGLEDEASVFVFELVLQPASREIAITELTIRLICFLNL